MFKYVASVSTFMICELNNTLSSKLQSNCYHMCLQDVRKYLAVPISTVLGKLHMKKIFCIGEVSTEQLVEFLIFSTCQWKAIKFKIDFVPMLEKLTPGY